MSKNNKKPEVIRIMIVVQHFIAISFLIFGLFGLIFGIEQNYTNKIIHSVILISTAIVAFISIRSLKYKREKAYIFSIISYSILIIYVFFFKFTEDFINLKLKDIQMITHDFFKDPFSSIFHFIFLFVMFFTFILSPKVKSYLNIKQERDTDKKGFKLIYIFLIYCALLLLNGIFQIFYFQPSEFKKNKQLVVKSEPFLGNWETVKSFENYDYNDGKFKINFNEDGNVIFSVPDEKGSYTVNWDGYIVDIKNNVIFVGEKLYNNTNEVQFTLNIEQYNKEENIMLISGKKNNITTKAYRFKKKL